MIDIEKHIKYWVDSAEDDLLTADLLLSNNRILHGLFFCHLVIEKIIKAHVVKNLGEIPPKSHNLIYLKEKADIDFDDATIIFLGILMKYQLKGRYPDYNPKIPDKNKAILYFEKTKEILKWVKEKL